MPVPSTVSGAQPTRTPAAAAASDHLRARSPIDGERLLAVDVLAVREGGERDLGVRGGDREVEHDVDVGIGEQRRTLERTGAGDARPRRRRPRGVEVGDAVTWTSERGGERLEVLTREMTPRPTTPMRVRVAHSIPLSMIGADARVLEHVEAVPGRRHDDASRDPTAASRSPAR